MADGKLTFLRPADGSGRLVFGDTGGEPPAPACDVSVDAAFAGDSNASIALALAVPLALDAGFTNDFAGSLALGWDAAAARHTLAAARGHWQDAAPRAAPLRSRWQDSAPTGAATRARWQRAQPLSASARAAAQASIALAMARRLHWQRAQPLAVAARSPFEQALHLQHHARLHWQRGIGASVAASARFQETVKLHRAARLLWQPALPLGAGWHLPGRVAAPMHTTWRPRYQEAMRPWPGGTIRPPVQPPAGSYCIDPATLGRLVFADPWDGSGLLVFVCQRPGGVDPDRPPATIVVIRRRSYIVLTDLEVLRADTGQPLPALVDGFHMRLDRQSWTWDFSVNLHAAALPLLQPGADGLPRELEVRVNGQPFRMLAESRRRSTQHPRSVLRVGGRGKAALLDAPFADVRSFTQPAARTAQQLMLDALAINGVSIGWDIDWGLTDWPVPADTWAHHGTWISAINDIAASLGAYVQPHDTDPVLRILPSYPVRSWQLASATPDIELPPGIATVEEVEWVTKPAYDAIYMHGEPGNAVYYRKRAGTPGTSPAPDAVHALLVHPDAAAQRAIAEPSDTGRQVPQTLTMPVLPETGIIKPGLLLRYTDDADVVRTGIVRGVSVAAGPARIEQTIEVQAHE